MNMLMLLSVPSFALNVTETKNILENGEKKTVNLSKYGDTIDYRIDVSESGSLKINITSLMEYTNIYVCDANGTALKPNKEKISVGDTVYFNLYGYCNTIWNGAMEKFSGSLFYEVNKGSYYIRFERESFSGSGKFAFIATFPSLNRIEPEIKINYVAFPLKQGATVQLSLSLSDKTSELIKWTTTNKKVATVTSNGKVTGKSKGLVAITASIGNSNYKIYIQVIG